VESPEKPCVYAKIVASLNGKKITSVTPISEALDAFILALKDSAKASVAVNCKPKISFLCLAQVCSVRCTTHILSKYWRKTLKFSFVLY
jgi:hypothetical protein